MLFGKKSSNEEKPEPLANGSSGLQGAPTVNGNAAASSNGSKAEVSPEDAKKHMAVAKKMAASFGEIVTLLMHSAGDKHRSLVDLEWLVVPAVARGQFALADAQSKESGAVAPVGAVLWALVSEDVDKRLSDLSTPLRLKPEEWRSGDIPWIVLATGNTRILAGLIQQITKTAFNDRQPKMRARGADGKVTVGELKIKEGAPAPT